MGRLLPVEEGKIKNNFEVKKREKILFVEKVDFRGDVYK